MRFFDFERHDVIHSDDFKQRLADLYSGFLVSGAAVVMRDYDFFVIVV
jgi:hypothetical protein